MCVYIRILGAEHDCQDDLNRCSTEEFSASCPAPAAGAFIMNPTLTSGQSLLYVILCGNYNIEPLLRFSFTSTLCYVPVQPLSY